MTLPPPYEIDCHAVASELREAMTKTEAVSDERLAEMLESARRLELSEWVSAWTELTAFRADRRAANSAGGVEVKADSPTADRDYADIDDPHRTGLASLMAHAVEAEPVARMPHSGAKVSRPPLVTYDTPVETNHEPLVRSSPVSAEVTVDRETFIVWLRQWAKSRFGVWITHNTAKGAHTALLAALNGGRENG